MPACASPLAATIPTGPVPTTRQSKKSDINYLPKGHHLTSARQTIEQAGLGLQEFAGGYRSVLDKYEA